MNVSTIQILGFLKTHCTKVRKRESNSYVELMMDNHKCIEFEKMQFYVPEDIAYSEADEIVYDHLIENYSL